MLFINYTVTSTQFDLVSWGRVSGGLVGWGGVGRSRVGRFVFVRLGIAFVLDIGGVTVAVGLVGDDLGATIGQQDTVGSGGHLAIASFGVRVVVVGGVILNGPGEAVRLGRL